MTMEQYETYLRQKDVAPLTLRNYLSCLRLFARWYRETTGERLTPQRLTPSDVREYRQYLLAVKGEKPNTVNQKLSALRAYAKWAKESGQIANDPTNGVRAVGKQPLAPRWLDKREEYAVLREAERMVSASQTASSRLVALRDYAMLLTFLHTGIRVGELCALELNDLELSERKGSLTVRSGKGGKQRRIPLNAKAREALQIWLQARGDKVGKLFCGRAGERITPSAVHRRLATLGRRAGVELHAHTLRHTFAKRLVDAGVTLEKVASLLGHADMNTTRIYITPNERDLERAVEVLE